MFLPDDPYGCGKMINHQAVKRLRRTDEEIVFFWTSGRGPLVKRLWICMICDMEVGNHRKPRFFTHWRTLSGHVRDESQVFLNKKYGHILGLPWITQLDAIICRILQRDRFKIFPECCDMEAGRRFSCLQLFHTFPSSCALRQLL